MSLDSYIFAVDSDDKSEHFLSRKEVLYWNKHSDVHNFFYLESGESYIDMEYIPISCDTVERMKESGMFKPEEIIECKKQLDLGKKLFYLASV